MFLHVVFDAVIVLTKFNVDTTIRYGITMFLSFMCYVSSELDL